MLVSVFTPTHNGQFLRDVWVTLQSQTHQNFEWVIVPNGEMSQQIQQSVQAGIQGDPRVRVVPAPDTAQGVGALKAFACSQCRGEVFVEVDHDDVLTDDCLDAIVKALQPGQNAFIYSDAVTLNGDGSPHLYNPNCGWRHYDWTYRGMNYKVNRSFEASPRSICEIFYAPDHVRAWTRKAYELTGGHDPKFALCDDHDLVARTYLAGADFIHIDRPLYIHRLNPDTTSQTNLKKIEQLSHRNRDRFMTPLVTEWCRRQGLIMLDLGGAHDCPPGFVPVDPKLASPNSGFKLTFEQLVLTRLISPGQVGCIRAYDFLEHVPSTQIPRLMNQVYDMLAPGGFLLSHTPSICDAEGNVGRGAFQDPSHLSFWGPNNLWYFTRQQQAKYIPESYARFQSVRVGLWYPSDWHHENFIPYLIWDAMSLKDSGKLYLPGPKEI